MASPRRSKTKSASSKPSEKPPEKPPAKPQAQGRIQRAATRLTSWRGLLIAGVIALSLGAGVGFAMVYLPDPSVVKELERYQPSIHSIIYDDEGVPFDEWVIERRQMVPFQDIPQPLHDAVLAAEDNRFYSHPGVDPIGVLRAVVRNVTGGWGSEGASTLTMQMSRSLWGLGLEKSASRKLIEAFYYSLQAERYFSKERIFELYMTQIFMGHNVYGFGAASDYYFGKDIKDLTLAESALLAGMPPSPNNYNPYRNPEAALRKRSIVLNRMYEEGFISAEERDEAGSVPLVLGEDRRPQELGAYFIEDIRKDLYDDYGLEIYESGIHVYTTLNPRIQAAAEMAVDRQLRVIDKRLGWRGAPVNLIADEVDPAEYQHPRWEWEIQVGDTVPAVVMSVEPEMAELRIGDRLTTLTPEQARWARTGRLPRLTDLLIAGDLISVSVTAVTVVGAEGAEEADAEGVDAEEEVAQEQAAGEGEEIPGAEEAGATIDEPVEEPEVVYEVALDQEPEIEAAALVIENHSGEVKAMVGGRQFDNSEFNRASQAVRQTGSAFKPFVYAAALRSGKTAADLLLDQRQTFLDPSTRQPYEPDNYHNEYIGITTLAEALSRSRNVVTVALQEEIGADKVIDTARDLGITAGLQPYLSLALGVIDISLWEMTRAYAVFPNQGVRVEPHLVREVRDRQGRALRRTERQAVQVLDNDVAYLMTRMLTNVVEYTNRDGTVGGTARRARPMAHQLGLSMGGKTGTTDNYSDAWFVGFSPYHTIGIWVGNDTKKPIGPGEEGARAALPVWIEIMAAASEGKEPREFPQPAGVVVRTIDPRTGMLASEVCDLTIEMAFIEGTEPAGVCTLGHHQILALPYYQQAYFLDRFQSGSAGAIRRDPH
jgi:penicillin-binding protein 1A